ncbi:MAG: nucleoside-diphosphate sugar epimerase/dehydratase [Bacteroidales bacterium]|nr:nucleoside-diphosphate sugar epimerase/dehydratase [Bacteroidales bacterium]
MFKEMAYKLGRSMLRTHPPRWIIFALDTVIYALAFILAFYIRLNFDLVALAEYTYRIIIPVFIISRAIAYLAFKLYSGLIRYSTVRDLERIIVVNLTGTALIVLSSIAHRFITGGDQNLIPLGVIIIEFLLSSVLMISLRLLIKTIYFEINNNKGEVSNVVIYGVDDLAHLTMQAVDSNKEFNSKVVGLINTSDDPGKCTGNTLAGVKIYSEDDMETLSRTKKISKLIIAREDISLADRERLIEKCSDLHIKVLTVPIADNWIDGKISASQIRELKLEDLLERPAINLDKTAIEKEIKDKVILVTGAAGSIGSELVRQISEFSPSLIVLYDQAETPLHSLMLELEDNCMECKKEIVLGDITNEYRLEYIFSKYRPDFVFHAAAYKHVPMLEDNPKEAMRTNVFGTKILADLSRKFKVGKFVMISTDKAVNPTSIMGASKRIAEMYIQSLSGLNSNGGTHFITTRFGNVLGSNGSVVERFKQQIEKGGAITVTHPDVARYFMTIPEAVQLVLEASAMGRGGEIFVFDMGKMVKIKDLAANMIRLSGLIPEQDIKIKYIGLRPGERLYEELLAEKENLLATYHPKILRARVNEVAYEELQHKFDELYSVLHEIGKKEVVSFMKAIVPEFKSMNPEYAELDIKAESQKA